MSLPSPGSGIYWKEYEILTPTYRLTSVEKPDMSPFLVHMTGRDSLSSILQSGDRTDIDGEHGFLKAAAPAQQSVDAFDAQVVCFTESPTFALDFFRYRSYRRWRDDQRFGIGFDKSSLVAHGVRPVVYGDTELVRDIVATYHRLVESSGGAEEEQMERFRRIVYRLYPLLFPLLEEEPDQGFMWEREWRYPFREGLVFSYSDIRVVCCPEDEEQALRDALGGHCASIQFVETWRQYADVTGYLERQHEIWDAQTRHAQTIAGLQEKRVQLEQLRTQYDIALHSLQQYREYVERLNSELTPIEEESARILAQKEQINQDIKSLDHALMGCTPLVRQKVKTLACRVEKSSCLRLIVLSQSAAVG